MANLMTIVPVVCALVALPTRSMAQTESLGKVDFAVACTASVRDEFNRAVALLHHMTYPAARSAFQAVAEQDPDCALAYWGIAMTLFQPLWPTRPGDKELRRGWELVQEARRRVHDSPRERMFVAAGEAFFDPAGAPDYWTRIDRWAAAATAIYEAYPEDYDAGAFFALAHLATGSRSGSPADHHATSAGVLSRILAEEPTHPGAVHYTIHANDFYGRQNESLEVVRSYGEIAPRNPHALHMPTHIFVRLGEWDDVIDWNQRASEAALAQRVGPNAEYVWNEYPHAVGYLVYAYLQKGDDASARETIRALTQTPDIEPGFKTAFHLATTASRYALERRAWEEAVDLQVRSRSAVAWEQFPWPAAVTWFARGLGAAHTGATDRVQESVDRLAALSDQARRAGEALFAAQIEMLRLEVAAWEALTAGDHDEALRLMKEAVTLEERTPKPAVTPGPILPARELLGDLHAAMGEPALALEAYRASNDRTPGRFNGLLGIARSSVAVGDVATARAYYRRVLDGAESDSERPGVSEARGYVSRGR